MYTYKKKKFNYATWRIYFVFPLRPERAEVIADVLLLRVITVLGAVGLELSETHRRHGRVSQRGFGRTVYDFVGRYQHRFGVRHFLLRQEFRFSESSPVTDVSSTTTIIMINTNDNKRNYRSAAERANTKSLDPALHTSLTTRRYKPYPSSRSESIARLPRYFNRSTFTTTPRREDIVF